MSKSDVVIENFRPGTLEKWNCGWEELSSVNPRLILVRVSGYGQSGPYSQRAGYGGIGEAMGGLRYIVGEPDRPPSRVGISIGDSLAAVHACMGTLAALHHRERTGIGQVVDAAIYESVLNMMESSGHRIRSARPRARTQRAHPAAHRAVECLPDAGWHRDDWRQPGHGVRATLRSHAGSGARHRCALSSITRRAAPTSTNSTRSSRSWTATLGTRELLALLEKHGVPSGLIYRAADMLEDPHFQAREAIVTHPRIRISASCACRTWRRGCPRRPVQFAAPAPELGQHNDEVYGELLAIAAPRLAPSCERAA